jgi:hypothetical protein
MAYEEGEMTHAEVVAFFQHLIESGLISKMPDSYGRISRILIERGECHLLQDGV